MRGEKDVLRKRVGESDGTRHADKAVEMELWGRGDKQTEETRKREKEDWTKKCMKITRINLLLRMLI